MHYPAVTITILYICGLLVGHYTTFSIGFFSTSLIVVTATACGLYRWQIFPSWLSTISLVILMVSTGAFWYTIQVRILPNNHIGRFCDLRDPVIIKGRIFRDPDIRSKFTLITVATDSVITKDSFKSTQQNRWRVTGPLLVRIDSKIDAGSYGDIVRISGYLRTPTPIRNPGGFDSRSFYFGRGIYGLMSVRNSMNYEVVQPRKISTLHTVLFYPIKFSIEQTINQSLKGESAALIKGILLGQRQQLPDTLQHTFSSIGLTHILAVSGLHVGLIILVSLTICSVIRLPHIHGTITTIIVVLIYAFITNLTPSVVRASVMAGLFLTGYLLDRQPQSINIMAMAALIILIFWPMALFDLSFQLSFIATLSIVTGYSRLKTILLPKRIQQTNKWWIRWLRDAFAVSLAAQIGTTPLIAYVFFQVSWIAPIANLFIGPLVFLSTTLGVITAIVGSLSIDAARLFSATNWLVLQSMIELSRLFATIPSASITVSQPSVTGIYTYYIIWIIILWPPKSQRTIRWITGGLLIGVIGWTCYQWITPRQLTITMLDVGQGDAIFIECPNGRNILVDGGHSSPDFDVGERIIIPFLRSKGNPRIDTIVISHPHLDHYGGLSAVLSHANVGEVIDGGRTSNNSTFQILIDTMIKKRVSYRSISAGDTLAHLGNVEGKFLHPPLTYEDDISHDVNNTSVVLRLMYDSFSVLLTGDIEQEAEHYLIRRFPNLNSDILKVPHHGSQTSSTPTFLKAVRPNVGIISVGLRNRFRHPSPEVIARYQKIGTKVHRTDFGGAIIIRSDGHSFCIEQMIPKSPENRWITPRAALQSILLTGISSWSIFR